MNLDCQLLILERLNLSALLNVAQTNNHFLQLSTEIYRRKYSSRTISIRSSDFSPEFEEIYVAKYFDYIIITNLEIAGKMLNIFGHFITKLSLKCTDMVSNNVENITRAINDHCTDSLIQFEMDDCIDDVWTNLQLPFKKIKSVTLSGNVKTENVALNDLFPKLRELFLKDVEIYDRNAFRQTFPHLEHLLVVILEIEGFVETDVVEMITKNKQLKSLSLENASKKLLKFVSQHMLNLQSIEIVKYLQDTSNDELILFESVKNVSLNYNSEVPERIIFSQLTELKLECFPELSDTWIDFIIRNSNLSKLIINCQISETHIAALHLMNLIEVSFTCTPNTNTKTIIEFIESNNKIQKIELKTFDNLLKNELLNSKSLRHEWKVKDLNFGIEIERLTKRI